MSTISEILDRLSAIATVNERLAETARNVDKSLAWLLDHEKRLIRLESGRAALPSPTVAPDSPRQPPRKRRD